MEIKQITGFEALARAEASLLAAADRGVAGLQREAEEAIRHLRDAAAGLESLQAGLGGLLDRAAALYVTTFLPDYAGQGPHLSLSGLELRLPRSSYCVQLDPQWGRNWPQDEGPVLKIGQRYRVILVLEPIE